MKSVKGSWEQLGPSAALKSALGKHIGKQNGNSLAKPNAPVLKNLLSQTARPRGHDRTSCEDLGIEVRAKPRSYVLIEFRRFRSNRCGTIDHDIDGITTFVHTLGCLALSLTYEL